MFIYVNGDSNASGFELSHPILPSYPGHLPPGIINRINFLSLGDLYLKAANWLEGDVFKKEKKEIGDDRLRELDKEKSWPIKLQKLLGCDMYVNAIPGSSTVRVALTVQQDLLRFKKQNKIPDVVIVQLTDWIRTSTFDLSNLDLCTNINFSKNNDNKRKVYANAWYDLETEQDMIFRYLHHWVMIKHTIKLLTGKEALFVDSIHELHVKDLLSKAEHPLQLELIEELGWKNFNPKMSMSYYHDINNDYLHPGLHLSEPVHDKFANALATELKTNWFPSIDK